MDASIFRVKTHTPGSVFLLPAPPATRLNSIVGQLAGLGVSRVVSLLTEQDTQSLGLEAEQAVCSEHSIAFSNFPIPDFGTPPREEFRLLVAQLHSQIHAGWSIAVHCRAGIGRTGTLASCLLISCGLSPEEAIARVSQARRTSVPDTAEQRKFIEDFVPAQPSFQ